MARRRKNNTIGKLDRRITIQHAVTTRNEHNEEVVTWEKRYTRWGSVKFQRGYSDEKLEALQEVSTNNVVFTMYRDKLITAKMRVVYETKVYNILHVDEVDDSIQGQFMQLICEQKDDIQKVTE